MEEQCALTVSPRSLWPCTPGLGSVTYRAWGRTQLLLWRGPESIHEWVSLFVKAKGSPAMVQLTASMCLAIQSWLQLPASLTTS